MKYEKFAQFYETVWILLILFCNVAAPGGKISMSIYFNQCDCVDVFSITANWCLTYFDSPGSRGCPENRKIVHSGGKLQNIEQLFAAIQTIHNRWNCWICGSFDEGDYIDTLLSSSAPGLLKARSLNLKFFSNLKKYQNIYQNSKRKVEYFLRTKY